MNDLILTVQSTGNHKWRLGISYSDSKTVFNNVRHFPALIILERREGIWTKTTCGFPNKKGFDLYSKEINAWIIANNFHHYEKYKPTKLQFSWKKEKNHIALKFVEKISLHIKKNRQ